MLSADDDRLSGAAPWLMLFAHPGHELRAYHLLERVRPCVIALTDGSGSAAEGRTEASRALVTGAGAQPASMFGALTDRDAYAALMAGAGDTFLSLLDAVERTIVVNGIRTMVVDAAEGFNPVHDVCHWIGRAAAMRVRRAGTPLDLFEIDLVSHPDSEGEGLRLVLDDDAFARKLEAVARYAALQAEAHAAFDRYGREAFRVEFLRPVADKPLPPASWVPYYEEVGEERVRAGRYPTSLRFGSHVRPVLATLLESASHSRHATAHCSSDE
jgi:hypothetical protein